MEPWEILNGAMNVINDGIRKKAEQSEKAKVYFDSVATHYFAKVLVELTKLGQARATALFLDGAVIGDDEVIWKRGTL